MADPGTWTFCEACRNLSEHDDRNRFTNVHPAGFIAQVLALLVHYHWAFRLDYGNATIAGRDYENLNWALGGSLNRILKRQRVR